MHLVALGRLALHSFLRTHTSARLSIVEGIKSFSRRQTLKSFFLPVPIFFLSLQPGSIFKATIALRREILHLPKAVILGCLLGYCLTCAYATSLPPAARGLLLDVTLNDGAILAVGEQGAIIRSTDSGVTWSTFPALTSATLTGITFGTPLCGWAVGHEGVILHTEDGGATWREQFRATDPETVFLDVAALDGSHAIAVGAFGVCYTTEDGGRSWLQHKLIDADNHLNRVSRAPDGTFLIAGERGTLLRLSSFAQPPLVLIPSEEISFYGLWSLPDNALLAHGLRGHLFRSTDDGLTWNSIECPAPPALLVTALPLRSGALLVVGQSRTFLVSHDGGLSFQNWQAPTSSAVAEIVESPDGQLIAVGEAGVTRFAAPRSSAPATIAGSPSANPASSPR